VCGKQTISGADLVFGNDFDRPIRDRLPPGTNYAIRLVKWMIDPGLEGDAYADRPYMYGPALSSWNYFRVCDRVGDGGDSTDSSTDGEGSGSDTDGDGDETGDEPLRELHEEVIEEGGEGDGRKVRRRMAIPTQPGQRKKFFLDEQNRNAFQFEAGRLYKADFGNPYLVFNDFSLRLPGFTVYATKYIDEKNHELRYVLKNRSTGDVYFVLLFTLLLNRPGQENLKLWDDNVEDEVD